MKNPDVILITGASSGIGEALARAYARKGVKLLLTGRSAERLLDVEKRCRALGAAVKTSTIDVTDKEHFEKQVHAWDDQEPIDLVIANAGVSGGDGMYSEILETNIGGVFHTVHPLVARMQARGRGHIAVMSSMAGLRGLPNAPAYSASKVAVRAYGEALRALLAPQGLRVSVIMPGFVRTPLTDKNKFPMPFIISADKAAQIIKRGLEGNKRRVAFPLPMYLAARIIDALPPRLADFILSKGPKKG